MTAARFSRRWGFRSDHVRRRHDLRPLRADLTAALPDLLGWWEALQRSENTTVAPIRFPHLGLPPWRSSARDRDLSPALAGTRPSDRRRAGTARSEEAARRELDPELSWGVDDDPGPGMPNPSRRRPARPPEERTGGPLRALPLLHTSAPSAWTTSRSHPGGRPWMTRPSSCTASTSAGRIRFQAPKDVRDPANREPEAPRRSRRFPPTRPSAVLGARISPRRPIAPSTGGPASSPSSAMARSPGGRGDQGLPDLPLRARRPRALITLVRRYWLAADDLGCDLPPDERMLPEDFLLAGSTASATAGGADPDRHALLADRLDADGGGAEPCPSRPPSTTARLST